jgi:DNA-binding response OmpR family regulator
MTSPATILVVDDERPLVELVAGYLAREGFRVLRAYDGAIALEMARREAPDLVVLDVMLPELDGIEVCRQLRRFSDAYVLMLTARTEEIDAVVGLSVGADDYVTKPFSPRELVARIRAMLRRPRRIAAPATEPLPPPPERFDGLLIDYAGHEVRRGDDLVTLTPIEFELLTSLAANPGVVLTRSQLIERVWGRDFPGDAHVVDVHLSNLRHKLEPDPAQPRYVETIRGVGYRFRRPRR